MSLITGCINLFLIHGLDLLSHFQFILLHLVHDTSEIMRVRAQQISNRKIGFLSVMKLFSYEKKL